MADWIAQYNAFTKTPWSPTKLKEDQEQKFREWLKSTQLFNSIKEEVAFENKIPVKDLNNDKVIEMILRSPDYDYRGAYLSGIKEVIDPTDKKPHWPSSTLDGKMLKDPNHPTAWKEFFMRQYDVDPDSIGLDTFEKAINWQNSMKQQQNVANPFYQDPFGTMQYMAP